jgi:hypothetical protein
MATYPVLGIVVAGAVVVVVVGTPLSGAVSVRVTVATGGVLTARAAALFAI